MKISVDVEEVTADFLRGLAEKEGVSVALYAGSQLDAAVARRTSGKTWKEWTPLAQLKAGKAMKEEM